jgi:hypothetical protein
MDFDAADYKNEIKPDNLMISYSHFSSFNIISLKINLYLHHSMFSLWIEF